MPAPVPDWFPLIRWSTPIGVEVLRKQRELIPKLPGVYVFTNYSDVLSRNYGVLYLGKANSLAQRLSTYLVDPAELMVMSARSGQLRQNNSLNHAAKVNLLTKFQQRPTGFYVRWTTLIAPLELENKLIKYLEPAFNVTGKP